MDADWKYDSEANAITHVSGFRIAFDGEPESKHFTGSPSRFPRGLSSLQIATLIREGFDFYRKFFTPPSNSRRTILKLKAGAL